MKEFLEKGSIQFVGIKDEDEFEKTKAISTAKNVFEKIKKMSKGDTTLVIHVKRHQVKGSKKKYSVRARINWPGNFFEAKEVNWNFLSTTQSVLLTLVREVKKAHKRELQKKG